MLNGQRVSSLAARTSPGEACGQPVAGGTLGLRLDVLARSTICRELVHQPWRAYKLETHDRASSRVLPHDVGVSDNVLQNRSREPGRFEIEEFWRDDDIAHESNMQAAG